MAVPGFRCREESQKFDAFHAVSCDKKGTRKGYLHVPPGSIEAGSTTGIIEASWG